MMQNELMWMLMENEAHHGAGCPHEPSTAGHEHLILRLLGDSPATLLRDEGPT
jgi:hypothetical protein